MSKSPQTIWLRLGLSLALVLVTLLAVAQSIAPTSGFAVESVTNQSLNGRPTAVVRFNRPLNTTQVFDQLATIKTVQGEAVSGSWALSRDAQALEFPFLQSNSQYRITIAASLLAGDGTELGQAVEQTLGTTTLPADARFMSSGSVIPRNAHQGLPISSTNLESVDVEFLRVRPEHYAGLFLGYPLSYGRWPGVRRQAKRAGGDSEAEYNWKSDLERITDFTDSVYQQRFSLDHPSDQRALTYLPVHRIKQVKDPGIYMAVMKLPNTFPNNWHTALFFVTDLGLHARRYEGRVWVHAASLKTGKALEGARVSALAEGGNVLVEGKTDAQGNVWLDAPRQSDGRTEYDDPPKDTDTSELLLLSAQYEDDVAMLPFNQPAIDLSALPITGRKQALLDVFSWGSRDLYRPGETITVHLLLRDKDGHLLAAQQPVIAQLLDPNGESVENRSLDSDTMGYLKYSYTLADDAVTGLYKLRLSPGADAGENTPFSMDLHVEEFLPERLKIDLESPQARLSPGEALQLKASSAYLYGAPAGGNRFVASMVLKPADHPIVAFPDFHFGDASARFDSTPTEVLDATFDEAGLIETEVSLAEVATDKGPIEVNILGEVQETGGRAVNKVLKRVIWPAPVLLGVRPQFNDDSAPGDGLAKLELIASNAEGQRQAVSQVKVRVLRDWRDYSWYYGEAGGLDVSVISATTVDSESVVDLSADGRPHELTIPVKWGGYWVELIHPESGVVTRYHFSAGWSWGDSEIAREPRPDQIKLELDKPAYKIGDTARLSIHSPHAGPGFVLVESSQQLFYAAIEAGPDASVEIPVDSRFDGHNIYVSALVLRPDGSSDALVPSRALGMIRLPLDRTDRSLQVKLESAPLVRPGAAMEFAIAVPGLKGQRGHLVLTAVDAGITNITRYRVPDPIEFFFGPRRFALDLYDIYGRVVENYAGKRAQLRYGGDSEPPELPKMPRDKLEVKLIDLYEGPLQLDADGKALIKLTAPDFDGTLKVTALVFGDERFGRAESELIVRQPVVVQLSAPRALAPGDLSTLAVDVRNLSGAKQGLQLDLAASAGLEVTGELEKSLNLDDGAKSVQMVGFTARQLGAAELTLGVRANGAEISRSVSTVVRPAWAPERRIEQQTLAGPVSLQPPASLLTGLQPGARIQLTLSNRPLLPLATAAHEITEKLWWYSYLKLNVQRGFAHLLLDAPTRERFGLSALNDANRIAVVQAAINEAVAAQTPLGHFNMWGNDSWIDTQLTPYIAEFWIKARQAGFSVDQAALDRTLERMNQDLLNGGNAYLAFENHEAIRFANNAYAGWVMSLNKAAPIGTLRTLFNEHAKDAKTMLPLVQLGLALRQMGDVPLGDQALAAALKGDWDNAWSIGDYGSTERDLAWSWALLNEAQLLTPEWQTKLQPLARNLAARSRDKKWRGSFVSIDESLALVRLGAVLLKEPGEMIEGQLQLGALAAGANSSSNKNPVSGGSLQRIQEVVALASHGADLLKSPTPSSSTTTAIHAKQLYSVEFSADQAPATRVKIDSAGPLYVEWTSVGFGISAPPPDQSQIAISREYYTLDGAPFTGSELKQGDRLLVHLRVQAERDLRDGVLVDLQPGGLEVENLHLGDFAELANVKIEERPVTDYTYGTTIRRQEYLDDRYLASIDFATWHGGTINLFYVVRAVTPGQYSVPPPFAEDMYRPQVRGVGEAVLKRLQVR